MRRLIAVLAMTFVATAALAADADKGKTQLSIFTSNLGFVWTERYSDRTGGLGLALSRSFTPHWSAELKIADERHIAWLARHEVADPAVFPAFERHSLRVIPIDLLAQYRFPNSSRWTPYVSAGYHYASSPTLSSTYLYRGQGSEWEIRKREVYGSRGSAEIGVGTSLRITPHFGLRFDVNTLMSNDTTYDPMFRPSFGVSWRF